MKLGDTLFNGNQFKNVILNSTSYKRLILGVNLVWSYFSIAIKSFKTRILSDGGTYEAESILEDRLQEITPNLFDSASLVITPNGVKTSKLYTIKPNDGTGDLSVTRATTATIIDENGNIVNVPANMARIDYANGSPAILSEPQRTNLVYPSDIATTQVRAVTAQVYTLSFYGSGSVALSGAFSGTLNGTGTNNRVSLTFTPTSGNLTLTVSGSVTNWQLEAGSNATSLIKTISGSVTRNLDVISKSGVSSLLGQTEGSIYCEIDNIAFNKNAGIFVLQNSADQFNNRIGFRYTYFPIGYLNAFIRTGTNEVVILNSYLPIVGEKYKMCFTYNQTQQKFFINGVLVSSRTGSYAQPNNLNEVQLGNMALTGFPSTVGIKSALVFKNDLTDQQAIQLTTL